jgi:hypothetical protein
MDKQANPILLLYIFTFIVFTAHLLNESTYIPLETILSAHILTSDKLYYLHLCEPEPT